MNDLLTGRRHKYHAQNLKYLRYVFNDHFLFFLVIGIGALAVQYASFLRTGVLPLWGKVILILSLSLVTISFGKISTFLEEPDQVFLLPKEEEVKTKIQKDLVRSLFFPAWIGLVLILVAAPALKFSWVWLLLWFLLLLTGKYLLLRRKMSRFISEGHLNWTETIQYERERRTRILKVFSLFTTVKGLTVTAKRRKYLDFPLPKQFDNSYAYLYPRIFLRSGDYLGLVLRLLLLSLLALVVIPAIWPAFIFAALINYLIIFQLLPIGQGYESHQLMKVYPNQSGSDKKALEGLILRILALVIGLEVVFFLVFRWKDWVYIIGFLFVMLGFTYLYVSYRTSLKVSRRKKP